MVDNYSLLTESFRMNYNPHMWINKLLTEIVHTKFLRDKNDFIF